MLYQMLFFKKYIYLAFTISMHKCTYVHTYVYVYAWLISPLLIGATVSLNRPNYSVGENDGSVVGIITLSKEASEDVIVEVTISDVSANGNVV